LCYREEGIKFKKLLPDIPKKGVSGIFMLVALRQKQAKQKGHTAMGTPLNQIICCLS
jgi:hypothetical protein